MADRNMSEGHSKSRRVLGDLTNRLGKRGFLERERNGNKISNLDNDDKDLAKRMRLFSSPLCSKISSSKENVISNVSNIVETDCIDGFCLKENNAVVENLKDHLDNKDVEILNLSGETETDVSQSISKLDVDKEIACFDNDVLANVENEMANKNFEASDLSDRERERAKNSISTEDSQIDDIIEYQYDGDDHNGDNLVFSQCGSIDCTILPESQESTVFGAEKFVDMKNGNECACMGEGIDSIKACSCSFCTKAGYIWLDLNYQDIKSRVSALRKSQKEASILAERISMSKGIEKHSGESFSRAPNKLESDLTCQWRSLFQCMADVMEQESNQLEARLLPLNDLRNKCKTDLELIGAQHSENR